MNVSTTKLPKPNMRFTLEPEISANVGSPMCHIKHAFQGDPNKLTEKILVREIQHELPKKWWSPIIYQFYEMGKSGFVGWADRSCGFSKEQWQKFYAEHWKKYSSNAEVETSVLQTLFCQMYQSKFDVQKGKKGLMNNIKKFPNEVQLILLVDLMNNKVEDVREQASVYCGGDELDELIARAKKISFD